MKYTTAFLALFALIVHCAQALAGEVSLLNDVQFQSDNFHLTERVNVRGQTPYSAAVDTAQLMFDALGYDRPVINVPLNRSFQQMNAGSAVCVVNRIQTPERANKYLISLPLNFFHTQRLYQLAELPPIDPQYLDENGHVKDIAQMISAYPASSLVIPRDYSFGEMVDNAIARMTGDQVVTLSNDSFYTRFLQLFARKRADFALIFPASIYKNFGEEMPIDVRHYSIANNPEFVSGRVICANTRQGAILIKRINQAIEAVYQHPDYIESHTRYLPRDSHDDIARIINNEIN